MTRRIERVLLTAQLIALYAWAVVVWTRKVGSARG